MTCRFMACERAKDGEGAAARSPRAVWTTSGSAMALRPVLVMVCPSWCATAAQCRRRVRRNHMRTITETCQCRRHHSPFLGQGREPAAHESRGRPPVGGRPPQRTVRQCDAVRYFTATKTVSASSPGRTARTPSCALSTGTARTMFPVTLAPL